MGTTYPTAFSICPPLSAAFIPIPTVFTPHTCSPSCMRYGYDRCQGSSSTIPMCSKLSPPSVLTAAPMSPCWSCTVLVSYNRYTVCEMKGEGSVGIVIE